MNTIARIVEGGALADVAEPNRNGGVFAYLEAQHPQCHSDPGDVLIDAARPLAECVIYSPSFRRLHYVAAIVHGRIFAIGFGQRGVAVRLPPEERARALAEGEKAADYLGAEWIALELFRSGWSRGEMQAWVRSAHAFANSEWGA